LIEAKGFHAHDGRSISLAGWRDQDGDHHQANFGNCGVAGGGDLRSITFTRAIQDKASVFAQILARTDTSAEAAFVGDDVIDLPAMRKCGLAIA